MKLSRSPEPESMSREAEVKRKTFIEIGFLNDQGLTWAVKIEARYTEPTGRDIMTS
jgi:hypothetical protein